MAAGLAALAASGIATFEALPLIVESIARTPQADAPPPPIPPYTGIADGEWRRPG